mmetsp:Transcript_19714/g.50044  ORF Transcript_19714/g.50044 Transcript_19714/m.50044 type:complete len:210 (+) Transcript_19714:134-763(+)
MEGMFCYFVFIFQPFYINMVEATSVYENRTTSPKNLEVSLRTRVSKALTDGLVGSTDNAVGQGELDGIVVEVVHIAPLGVLGSNLPHFDDLDVSEASAMTTSHIVVELGNSTAAGGIAELLVDVGGAGAAVITENNTVVLHNVRLNLKDLIHAKDFACCLLGLHNLPEKVEEATLGPDVVRSEDTHAVDLGGGIGVGRTATADNREFLQ